MLSLSFCNIFRLLIGKNNIKEEGSKHVGSALKANKSLAVLDLSENEIGGGVEAIFSALDVNRSLISLNLSNNCIGAKGAKAMSSAVKGCLVLKHLNISITDGFKIGGNQIGKEGAKYIAKTLLSLSALLSLHIGIPPVHHRQQLPGR